MPLSYSRLGASSAPIPEHPSPVCAICAGNCYSWGTSAAVAGPDSTTGDIKGARHKLQIKEEVAFIQLLIVRSGRTVASPYGFTPIWYYFLAMKHDGALFLSSQSPLKIIFIPVMELTTERKIVGGLISSFNMLDSVASGKPLSNISSRSSYTITTLSLIAVSEHSPK